MSGTFYNPDYGFVRLNTEPNSPLEIANADEHPRAGAIIIKGKNNSAVKLTAIDNTYCRVEADTDGDGIYDMIVDSIPWSDL